MRKPAILKEARDTEVAVDSFGFHSYTTRDIGDPVGFVLDDIKTAMDLVKAEGRKLSSLGQFLEPMLILQDKKEQHRKLGEAGVVVCKTNHIAARLATEIIKVLKERA